eukprot:scaffold1593_cov193-Alexandrium_tamarense.AAC.99
MQTAALRGRIAKRPYYTASDQTLIHSLPLSSDLVKEVTEARSQQTRVNKNTGATANKGTSSYLANVKRTQHSGDNESS